MFLLRWLLVSVKPLVSRFPRFAAMYRGMRDQLEGTEEPQPTPWGFKLAGNVAMAQGTFEPVETGLIIKLLDEVDVFINVGANVGYYCCHALGMGKSVIAFEPVPRNLLFLCKNLKANGWDGAEIFPVALSNKVGILEIYGGNTGASLVKGWAGTSESYKTLVPCSTMDLLLDSRLKGNRALILVDIEGAEKWMLEGAGKMLHNEPKPIWVVEIVTSENQPDGVTINPNFATTFQLFFENGYEAFTADQEMRRITFEDVALFAKGVLKAGTHNFMFRELKK